MFYHFDFSLLVGIAIRSSKTRRGKDEPRTARRPQGKQEGIMHGDVFDVSGDLASKKIAPGDAAAMQSAETAVLDRPS